MVAPEHPLGSEHPEGFDYALGASYRLISRLGAGASGEVWRTEHRRTGDIVATKLLRPEHLADRMLVRRFFEERDVLTGLRHHGVVAVRDLVAEGDRLAIVMEYVDGGSLGDVLRSRGPFPPTLAVDVTAAVLDGLAAAHAQGVVHRDIKPDNVLLTREWWSLRPGDIKLVDFGIAQILTENSSGMTGGLTGTPEFMAPELVAHGVATFPADLYGVGVLLYQLLAGRTPFAGPGNAFTIARRHIAAEPPPLELPGGLHRLLESLLAKDPGARPDAVSAAAALRAVRGELGGLPALPRQQTPVEFSGGSHDVTVLGGTGQGRSSWGSTPPGQSRPPVSGQFSTGAGSDILGAFGSLGEATTLRPPPSLPPPAAPTAPAKTTASGWRDPRLIVLVAGCLVLVLGVGLLVALRSGDSAADASDDRPTSTEPVTSRTPNPTSLPTGLRIDRSVTYDPATTSATMTLTYTAQDAPLTGPFLQAVPPSPGTDAEDCPEPTWSPAGDTTTNTPSETGISVGCTWSVDAGVVPANRSATVTADFALDLGGGDTQAALDAWLADAEDATDSALADADLTNAAYPVQRLVSVTIDTTRTAFPGDPLVLRFLPQWAGGGPLSSEPIYIAPLSGDQSEALTQVAGPDGVRLSEACGGNILIAGGTAAAKFPSSGSCRVLAQVGSLPVSKSNEIRISPRPS